MLPCLYHRGFVSRRAFSRFQITAAHGSRQSLATQTQGRSLCLELVSGMVYIWHYGCTPFKYLPVFTTVPQLILKL